MTVILKRDDQYERYKSIIAKFIKRGNFELKSGRYTSEYFDLKSFCCNGNFLLYAVQNISLSEDINYIGGMEYGAVPLSVAISVSYNYKPYFTVRKQTKNHGLGGRVISYVEPMFGKCCIIDDVVSTGNSIDDCIKVLKEEGHDLEIDSIICLVDRTRGSYSTYPIHSFFKEEDFNKEGTELTNT